jgi:hypothetical protein
MKVLVTVAKVIAASEKEFVALGLDGIPLWFQQRWVRWVNPLSFEVDSSQLAMALSYGRRHSIEDFPPLEMMGRREAIIYLAKVVQGPCAGSHYIFSAPRGASLGTVRSVLESSFPQTPKLSSGDCVLTQIAWANTCESLRNWLSEASSPLADAPAPNKNLVAAATKMEAVRAAFEAAQATPNC